MSDVDNKTEGQLSDPLIGTLLDEKLEIRSILGKGAHGIVYKAYHRLLDQFVAVKTLTADSTDSEKSEQRFLNEANLLSSFSQENIVRFHSFGKMADGRHYMVLEYLEGKTLAQLLTESKLLDTASAIEFFIQICSGLSYAHTKGVVHRDLKPANVMICQSKEGPIAKLLDFGIFKELNSQKQGLTRTGAFLGSVNYMSPEQCKAAAVDARSDIYSFGCLAYECLVGKAPMDDANDILIMSNHVSKQIKTLPSINSIPKDLEKLILRCLKKDPVERPASADEVLEELKSCRDQVPSGNGQKSNKPLMAASAIFLLLLVVAGTFYLRPGANPAPPQQRKTEDKKPSININSHDSDYMLKAFIPAGMPESYETVLQAEDWMNRFKIKTRNDLQNLTILYTRCMYYRWVKQIGGTPDCAEKIRAEFIRKKYQNDFSTEGIVLQSFYAAFLEYYRGGDEAYQQVVHVIKHLAPGAVLTGCQTFDTTIEAASTRGLTRDRDRLLEAYKAYAAQKSENPYVQLRFSITSAFAEICKQDFDKARAAMRRAVSSFAPARKMGYGIEPTTLGNACKYMHDLNMDQELLAGIDNLYKVTYQNGSLKDSLQPLDSNVSNIRLSVASACINLKQYQKAIELCKLTVKQFFDQRALDTHCDEFELLLLKSIKLSASDPDSKISDWKEAVLTETSNYLRLVKEKAPARLRISVEQIKPALDALGVSTNTLKSDLIESPGNEAPSAAGKKQLSFWSPGKDIANDADLEKAMNWLDLKSQSRSIRVIDLSSIFMKCIQVSKYDPTLVNSPLSQRIVEKLRQAPVSETSKDRLSRKSELAILLACQGKDEETDSILTELSKNFSDFEQRKAYRDAVISAIELGFQNKHDEYAKQLIRQMLDSDVAKHDKLTRALALLLDARQKIRDQRSKISARENMEECQKLLLQYHQTAGSISDTHMERFGAVANMVKLDPNLIVALFEEVYGDLSPQRENINCNDFSIRLTAARAYAGAGMYEKAITLAKELQSCKINGVRKNGNTDETEIVVLESMKKRGEKQPAIKKELESYFTQVKSFPDSKVSDSETRLRVAGYQL